MNAMRWLKEWRELRYFKKRWRRKFKGGAVVMSTWMDPDFLAEQAAERVRVPCARCGDGTDAPNTLCPSCARRG